MIALPGIRMHLVRCVIVSALSFCMLAGCALDRAGLASAPQGRAALSPAWAFEASDIPVDPDFRFGRLPNGLGYVLRKNANPRGTVQIRMDVAAGSLDEREDERGFAHFVEHMAFNGSTNLPEGEMIRILERHGLSNGPDTNASTDFEETTYRFDLPRNDPDLIALSLSLMREIASELTFDPQAVERARGVILSEMRERNTWQRRNDMDEARFRHPAALYPRRFSIGTPETLEAATAEGVKAFWRRVYDPRRTTIVVIGDVDDLRAVEREIRAKFSGWRARGVMRQPDPGPVDISDGNRAEIYLEPPISERMAVTRHGAWIDGPDDVALRQEKWLRRIGYGIVNRRFKRIARQPDPPFRDARLVTGGVFRSGRSTNLLVDTVDGSWKPGLMAAAQEYRRSMQFGFSQDEVAEQIATLRNELELAAASSDTRSNSILMNAIFDLLRDRKVPAKPEDELQRFLAFEAKITPESVEAALARDAVSLVDPLLRLEGSRMPDGGEKAMREAWNAAMQMPVRAETPRAAPAFAYTRFGVPGRVVSDTRESGLGIRTVRFANGVMLNLKPTRLERGRIRVQVNVDGGEMLNTRENSTVTQLARVLPVGGLGKHTLDDLQSIRAGHTTDFGFGATAETFVSAGITTPRDLEFQLQLYAALITDPAYRIEGEVEYRLNTNNYFNGLGSTPSSALNGAIGGIISDNDPRFTLQPVETYRALTFEKLRRDISDRLANGAIEVALVGDFNSGAAIEAVRRTFGALPPREREFRPYDEQRARTFTADRTPRVIWHTGPKDQALLRLTWPTRDDSDPVESLRLELLERIVLIELTEELRQRLGKAYSPEAASNPSRFYRFGAFAIAVAVDVKEAEAAHEAIAHVIAGLRDSPVSDDVYARALKPFVQDYDNMLKTNGGWMALVSRAQSEKDLIERQRRAKARLQALKPTDIQKVAREYLIADKAIEVLVLPEDAHAE